MAIRELIRTRRHLQYSIRELSESLGSSPATVALNLAAHHATGRPKNPTDCVIARYFSAIVGTERSVKSISVSGRGVHVTLTGKHFPVKVPLPNPVSTFIRAFDEGSYPDLIDRTEEPKAAGRSVQL
jgi:hypothetical protein